MDKARRAYRTFEDVLRSPWAALPVRGDALPRTDRVLRSTKLEDSIYGDLRTGDAAMDEVEAVAGEKLSTFPALSRDVYQAFYSLMLRRNEESDLSGTAQKFNKNGSSVECVGNNSSLIQVDKCRIPGGVLLEIPV